MFVEDPRQRDFLLRSLLAAGNPSRGFNYGNPEDEPPSISAAPRWEELDPVEIARAQRGLPLGALYGKGGPTPEEEAEYDKKEITSNGMVPYEHKGMFGVKGTLRDILGLFGDTITGNGTYGQVRRRERMSDSLRGFQDDPQNSVEELIRNGFPQEALKLRDDLENRDIQRKRYENDAANSQVLKASREATYRLKVLDRVGRFINSASDEEYQRQLPKIQALLANEGLDYEAESLAGLTKEDRRRWGIDPYRSNRLDDFDEDRELKEELGVSAEAGRNARAAQSQNRQDARQEKSIEAKKSGSGRPSAPSRPQAPAKPGAKPRFRIVG